MTKKEDNRLSLSYAYALSLKIILKGTFARVRELIRHYLSDGDSKTNNEYIIPLLCQQYSSLKFYIYFIEEKIEEENTFIDEKTGTKRFFLAPQDVTVFTTLKSSIDLCEAELALLNVSCDLH